MFPTIPSIIMQKLLSKFNKNLLTNYHQGNFVRNLTRDSIEMSPRVHIFDMEFIKKTLHELLPKFLQDFLQNLIQESLKNCFRYLFTFFESIIKILFFRNFFRVNRKILQKYLKFPRELLNEFF